MRFFKIIWPNFGIIRLHITSSTRMEMLFCVIFIIFLYAFRKPPLQNNLSRLMDFSYSRGWFWCFSTLNLLVPMLVSNHSRNQDPEKNSRHFLFQKVFIWSLQFCSFSNSCCHFFIPSVCCIKQALADAWGCPVA